MAQARAIVALCRARGALCDRQRRRRAGRARRCRRRARRRARRRRRRPRARASARRGWSARRATTRLALARAGGRRRAPTTSRSAASSRRRPSRMRGARALDLVPRARALGVPVVAIGGIDAGNARALADAGVDAVAVIAAVFAHDDPADVAAAARRIASSFVAAGARPMSRNDELFARAQRTIPAGVNSPVRAFRSVGGTPRFLARGEGAVRRGTRTASATSTTSARGARDRRPRASRRRARRARGRGARACRSARRPKPRSRWPRRSCARAAVARAGAARARRAPRRRCRALRLARGFTGRAEDRQVRGLLPRPRRQPAREGGLGRAHVRPAVVGRRAGRDREPDDRAAVQRHRRARRGVPRRRRRDRRHHRRADRRQHEPRRAVARLARRAARRCATATARC